MKRRYLLGIFSFYYLQMETNPRDQSPWKWGIFYYNKNDKRLFCPKRIPALGITVNFAHPYAIWFIAGLVILILILLLPSLLMTHSIH